MSEQLLQAFEVVQISVGFRVIANMEIDQMSTNVGLYATLWRSAEAGAQQIGRDFLPLKRQRKSLYVEIFFSFCSLHLGSGRGVHAVVTVVAIPTTRWGIVLILAIVPKHVCRDPTSSMSRYMCSKA